MHFKQRADQEERHRRKIVSVISPHVFGQKCHLETPFCPRLTLSEKHWIVPESDCDFFAITVATRRWLSVPGFCNHISCLLSDHHARRMCVSTDDDGHYTRIRHSESLYSNHPGKIQKNVTCLNIDHSTPHSPPPWKIQKNLLLFLLFFHLILIPCEKYKEIFYFHCFFSVLFWFVAKKDKYRSDVCFFCSFP